VKKRVRWDGGESGIKRRGMEERWIGASDMDA